MRRHLIYLFCWLVMVSMSQGQTLDKKTIAVIDLESRGATTQTEAITLTDRLRSLLVRTDAFTVVDRGRMEAILKEVGFQQTGCTSTECAVEVGRILNVERMVAGSIGKIGKLYTIDIVLIDVESSQILKSFTRDHKGEIEGLVDIMQDIAHQIAGIDKPETPKAPEVGSLHLISEPVSAEVLLDNESIGKTPLKMQDVLPGEHTIKFIAKGYEPKEGKIVVQPGKENKYKATLKKKGGKTWLWLGSGAILAAGGAVAATTLKDKNKKEET
ncbi:MAG: PEGA domain-containing protein, partial [candidate division KSB1 bacterium]|nr:PEGA domain-containing protein [candidate division KSB1 bacterium]